MVEWRRLWRKAWRGGGVLGKIDGDGFGDEVLICGCGVKRDVAVEMGLG